MSKKQRSKVLASKINHLSPEMVRVVISSPKDVIDERLIAEKVCIELNVIFAHELNIHLVSSRWEQLAIPGAHEKGPQGIVDNALKIPDCDVMIGLLWTRFGTPTSDSESGTEHEFKLAYSSWKKYGTPDVWFYFKTEGRNPENLEALKQWTKVMEFRENYPKEELFHFEFVSTDEYEDMLRKHLTIYLLQRAKRKTITYAQEIVASDSAEETELFLSELDSILDNPDFTPETLDDRINVTKLNPKYAELLKQTYARWQEKAGNFLRAQSSSFESLYRDYVIREMSRIHVRGLGSVAEVNPLNFHQVFVPPKLAFVPEKEIKSAATQEIDVETERWEKSSSKSSYSVLDILSEWTYVVVEGTPGSGKSTLMQYVALGAASGQFCSIVDGFNNSTIPFLIPVRQINEFDNFPDPAEFITSFFDPALQSDEAKNFVSVSLREGRAIILIDGLDECKVPHRQDMDKARPNDEQTEWDKLIRWLRDLTIAFPGNKVLVTSRPVGYSSGLLDDVGFKDFKLLPLSTQDQQKFVGNWCREVERAAMPNDLVLAESRGAANADDLISRIKRTATIKTIASSPLMLVVICIVHRYKGHKLPERRVELLSECVNVLLFEWRNAQGSHRNLMRELDAQKLRALLEPLAWEMVQSRIIEIDIDSLRSIFMRALPEINQQPERADEFISLVSDWTGVLLEVSHGYFGFVHLIFQEYLAAVESAQKDKDELLSHSDDPSWQEVIPMSIAWNKVQREELLLGLLAKGAVVLAGRSLAASDRVSAQVRTEILHELSQLGIKSGLQKPASVLSEIGGDDAVNCYMNWIKSIPMLTAEECWNHAATWKYKSSKWTVAQIGRRNAKRCWLCNEVDITNDWGLTRPIIYMSSEIESESASWSGFSISLRLHDYDSDEEPIDDLHESPAYSFAVILDTIRAFGTDSIWSAFKRLAPDSSISIEHRFLVLVAVLYGGLPKDHVIDLISTLQNAGGAVAPSLQIGMVNYVFTNHANVLDQDSRALLEDIWKDRVDHLEAQASKLIHAWMTSSTRRPPGAAEIGVAQFKKAFRDELAKHRRPVPEPAQPTPA